MSPNFHTVATCDEASSQFAESELRAFGCAVASIAPGVFGVSGNRAFPEISAACQKGELVFVRHLFPVQFVLASDAAASDLAAHFKALKTCSPYPAFSAQIRLLDARHDKGLAAMLSSALERSIEEVGGVVSRKDPLTVCSVIVTAEYMLGGVCDVRSALSSWPGGAVRYRKENSQISRAEFKLLEAMQAFDIKTWAGQRALDLGAAPGGWTKILAERGVQVTAVDPAALDARCLTIKAVTVISSTADEFLLTELRKASPAKFDLLLNDMRMDATESADFMVRFTPLLKPSARGVLTLKLPELSVEQTFNILSKSRSKLETKFKILGMRQLFHNRSEVTAVVAL